MTSHQQSIEQAWTYNKAQGAYLDWTIGEKTLTSLSDGFNPVDYAIIHSITPEKGPSFRRPTTDLTSWFSRTRCSSSADRTTAPSS